MKMKDQIVELRAQIRDLQQLIPRAYSQQPNVPAVPHNPTKSCIATNYIDTLTTNSNLTVRDIENVTGVTGYILLNTLYRLYDKGYINLTVSKVRPLDPDYLAVVRSREYRKSTKYGTGVKFVRVRGVKYDRK